MNENLISVIVPIYNTDSDMLLECIKSILNQTYKKIEIILVDDGSDKAKADDYDNIASMDIRIKIYHNKNRGVSYSRNFGLMKSKGKYISFVDADDLLERDMYKILINDIIENSSGISACGYNYIETDGKIYEKFGSNRKEKLDRELAIISMLNDESFGVSVWNKLFERSLLENVRFDETLKINEDRLFLFECICKSEYLYYNDVCLYNYIKRKKSATTSEFSESRFDVLKVNEKIENTILSKYGENKEIVQKLYKNENIYLIRLYRDIVLHSKKYKNEKKKIRGQLLVIYKKLDDKINFFDRFETILILRGNVLYPFIIKFLTKFSMIKKIKNKLQKREYNK